MKPPNTATSRLPIWQTALLTQGCCLFSGGQLFPLELRPIGDRLVCNPVLNGSMEPFNVYVTAGEAVIIQWDDELSRYIVRTSGQRLAA